MQLVFQDDCCEKPLELFHKLKLYEDAERMQQSTKKPVRPEPHGRVAMENPKFSCQAIHCIKSLMFVHGSPETHSAQVVSETYEELVFSEPAEAFWRRVGEHHQGNQPAPEPQLSCLANVSAFNPQVRGALLCRAVLCASSSHQVSVRQGGHPVCGTGWARASR